MNQKTIDGYCEALQTGAVFPPIEVQKIEEDGTEKIIVLDGMHRIGAYKRVNVEEIDVFFWKDEVLYRSKHLIELWLESITRNLGHGDRLSKADIRANCRWRAELDKDITIKEEEFAKMFYVTHQTINNWISDIRAKQKGSRDNVIFKLFLLGWAKEEISNVVGLKERQVYEILY